MTPFTQQLHTTKLASATFAQSSGKERSAILVALARELASQEKSILAANKKDLNAFTGDTAMRERLELNSKKLAGIVSSIEEVAQMADPIGTVLEERTPANGLVIQKISVPLGVIGIIYESRPNVTIDLAVLAIKTGNAAVLKGGKESYQSNKLLVSIIQKVLVRFGFSKNIVLCVDPNIDWKDTMLGASGSIDVLIPRGGAGLIDYVRKNARIPVIETGAGVVHTLIDEKYDLEKAVTIAVGSKIQRPSVSIRSHWSS